MYLEHSLQGNQTCKNCSNTRTLPLAFETTGLTTNEPNSCLVSCSRRYVPGQETCANFFSSGALPLNPEFVYQAGGVTSRLPCPVNTMSAAFRATLKSDCETCPSVPDSTGDACKTWICNNGAQQRGDLCYRTSSSTLMIPWQRPGFSRVGVQGQWVSSAYNFSQPSPTRLPGFLRFTLPGTNRSVEGRVCSAVVMPFSQRNYSIFTFCNTPAIYYLNFNLLNSVPGRLIGTTTGYREGFRNQAQFGDELFVAGFERRIYVADRLNCAIRVVNLLLALPGAYSARSYRLFGSPPLCEGVDTINRPYNVFIISSYVLFSTLDGVLGFDLERSNIAAGHSRRALQIL